MDLWRYHIAITALPGTGKTTVARKVVDQLKTKSSVDVHGFLTEEVQGDRGRRIGFDFVRVGSNERIPLARTELTNVKATSASKQYPMVGRYHVMVDNVTSVTESELENFNRVGSGSSEQKRVSVVVIDEVGKMECLSEQFVTAVTRLLVAPPTPNTCCILTIPAKAHHLPLVAQIRRKAAANKRLIEVNAQNRDSLPGVILEILEGSISSMLQ